MEKFNANDFIKSLKERYEMIPVIQGDQAAKVLVSDTIKAGEFNPEDVLSFICNEMGNPSVKLDDAGWKAIYKRAIKLGGLIGKCLEVCTAGRKGKVSPEDLFCSVVTSCGGNPDYLKKEYYLNQVVGWEKAADTLVKTAVTEETKGETSIKTKKMDPRCKSVTLVKDGVKKTWASYRECEIELGVKHGTISQVVSREMNSAKGWVLYEEEVTPVESKKRSKSKAIRQCGLDKDGHEVDKVWSSLSEASKATGIPYSSISKAVSGTYQSAGGYRWMVAESAA